MITLQQLRSECRRILAESGTARSDYCADVIIAQKLSLNRVQLIYRNDEIPTCLCDGVFLLISRRAKGMPLSYVLHEAEFYGYKYKVGRGVLIPRPETELLVEEVLKYYRSWKNGTFADWCTGSGCIGLTLLLENQFLDGVGIDISRSALRWAKINARHYGLDEKFKLINCGEPAKALIKEQSLDFITANPPYIEDIEMPKLMREVRDWEPHIALNGGHDGLNLYLKFFSAFPKFLKNGGMLFVEIAHDKQAEKLIKANNIINNAFVLINQIKDYNGIIRHMIWRKR